MIKSFKYCDVFSVLNADDAAAFINKKGFFGNTIYELQTAILHQPSNLIGIVVTKENKGNNIFRDKQLNLFSFFIPEVYVHDVYVQRPFKSMDEFIEVVGKRVGDVVTYKLKSSEHISTVMITGVSETDMSANDEIFFNGQPFTWNTLSDCQWRDDDGNWQDFLIKDKVDA